jgi:F-type H+-transporting ATPase subunit b
MSGWTLAFQIVNFLVLAALLKRFLFKPVAGMVARRQQDLERATTEGDRMRQEAEELRGRAAQGLRQIDQERERTLAEARTQMQKQRDEMISETRREAEAILEAARHELDIEREKAAKEMSGEALELAIAIARRLLEQVATVPVTEAFLVRLCEHIDGLPPERRGALRAELDGAQLLVATAPEVGVETAARWSARIGERLGCGPARFIRDDSLVAGAELRLPHTTISFSWRDGLRAAREELTRHADRR